MSIKEWIEGSGVYKVSAAELPESAWFVRDPGACEDGESPPLLHICEKDLDPHGAEPMWLIMTEKVVWDFYHGYYFCQGCKQTWDENDEAGLRAIWSDGLGTGAEGTA
jgi:hypothetical protein